MFCEKCGASISDEAVYCNRCGSKVSEGGSSSASARPADEEPQIVMMETVKKSSAKGIAIAIAAVLIIAGVGYCVADNYGHTAGIQIKVHSTHITETVDVQFYVDGNLMMTYEDLEPGYSCWNVSYFIVHFGIFDDSKLVTVKAVAAGGGLGTTSDSEDIIVTNGERRTVDLYI